MEFYVLYGTKDNNKYYISNIDPITWGSTVLNAKRYTSRYAAEYDILRNYYNYNFIKNYIKSNHIDELYIARMVEDNSGYGSMYPNTPNEVWRLKLV